MNLCDSHLMSYELETMGLTFSPMIATPLAVTWALQLVLAMKCEQKWYLQATAGKVHS